MPRTKIIAILAEFFDDEFRSDAAGVGDWLAQGGHDVDKFWEDVQALRAEIAQRDTAK